ncbi:MAG: hypothetical protein K2Z80_02785 [Xanthobacteraceae bacterium]|nr:hypothetical protein [Xanthobacteraceae bacterium]
MLRTAKPEHSAERRLSRNFQPRAAVPREQSSLSDEVRSDDELRYLNMLDQSIAEIAARKSTSFADLSQSCLGAWPGLIADRVAELNLGSSLAAEQSSSPHPLPPYSPELHCGFGEWYFSSDTADWLAREFISKKYFSIFLGTPTVAQRALAFRSDFTLVDSNQLVGLRFPELRKFTHYNTVEQLRGDFPRPSLVMFDAPWYLPRMAHWLSKASLLSTKSTTIVMPLFPSLTRPAASRERSTILELAQAIGRVELVPNCVSYDSPLYEWEAFLSRNICPHPRWRRADLVVIREPSPIPLSEVSGIESQEIWETYLIGSQVVRLRLHPMPRRRKFFVNSIAGTRDYVFDSVSARDSRRRLIDFWTSRNRVAIVGDIRRMRYVLSILSNAPPVKSGSITSALHSLLSPSEAVDLCHLLSLNTFH